MPLLDLSLRPSLSPEPSPLSVDVRRGLAALLRERIGHDLTPARLEQVVPVFNDLFDRSGAASLPEFLSRLDAEPSDGPALQKLTTAATIKESYFFRDRSTMTALRERILPALIDRCRATRVLRIWSAGCSSGEELYSIAILLSELLPDMGRWSLFLTGTDVDGWSIRRARRAIYGHWSLRVADDEEKQRYFQYDRRLQCFRLQARFRSNVSFALHNLVDPHAEAPAPGHFDLILCRNVLGYFDARSRQVALGQIRRALAPHGVWVAGASDPLPDSGFQTRIVGDVVAHELLPAELSDASEVSQHPLGCVGEAPETLPAPPHAAPEVSAPPPYSRERLVSGALAESAAFEAEPHAAALVAYDEACMLVEAGQFVNALAALERLHGVQPLWPEPYLLSARAFEALGDDQRAIEALHKVASLAPDRKEAWLRLGLLLSRSGQRAAAMDALRRVAAVDEHLGVEPKAQRLREQAARELSRLAGGSAP